MNLLESISDDNFGVDDSESYSDKESGESEKSDSSDDILDQINKMQQEKKQHSIEPTNPESIPEIVPTIIAPEIVPTKPIEVEKPTETHEEPTETPEPIQPEAPQSQETSNIEATETTTNEDTEEQKNNFTEEEEHQEEDNEAEPEFSYSKFLLSGILMISPDINTSDYFDDENSMPPIFNQASPTKKKSIFELEDFEDSILLPPKEEEPEEDTKKEILPKKFPNTLSEFSAFVCCGKTPIFLFDYGKCLTAFFAHDLHSKYKTFDFDDSPPSRKNPIPKWENIKLLGSPFPTLKEHATACLEKNNIFYLYTFGGFKFNSYMKDLLIIFYSKGFCTYREFTPNSSSPVPRMKHTLTTCGDKIYLFGGISETSTLLNDFWVLDTSVNGLLNPIWKLVPGECPPPRHSHAAYCLKNKLYIVGGYDQNNEKLNDIWRFDGEKWTLFAAFDSNKNVFPSYLGLISFEPKYEIVPRLPASRAFSSKFIKFQNDNVKHLKKAGFYSRQIRYEQEAQQKIRHVLDRLKNGKSPQALMKEITSIFNETIEMTKVQKMVFDEANRILQQFGSKLSDRGRIYYNYYNLNHQLHHKQKVFKHNADRESDEQNEDLQLAKKYSKELLSLQIQRPPSALPKNFTEDITVMLKDFNKDESHQTLFSHFYYVNQQLQYESNKKEIQKLKERIQHYHNKLNNQSKDFSQYMKLLTDLQSDIETTKKKTEEWRKMDKEIELEFETLNALREYNENPNEFKKMYEELEKENKNIKDQIKVEIETIANKKEDLETLKKLIETIRTSFVGKSEEEVKKVLQELVPKLNDTSNKIFK
ncbi:multiple epidermal growth factor-like domains protein 8 isoform X1 [Histomonas meleagridis]|uniref:multiple epidermal growth factor-like domains protein 8 isoform X1 n=1 Tax=Histomonas meleagridis TaxID=135588 RepID=UPI003559BDEE|nr:multiple epidermal growth factor-like domains protein 8 isoform X1 [Histomonas meleagridis]KAH0805358.1 multiple epidermal growth factor-like domains protein 8 isoform X1 [Histomonas meleagridis]